MSGIVFFMYTTLVGIIAVLSTALIRGKWGRLASTLASLLVYAVLLVIVLQDKSLNGLVGLTSLVIGLASTVSSLDLIGAEENKQFHDALILALTSASYLVVSTKDLLRLFVLWEFMSIAVAVLAAYHRRRESVEASLKYIVMCGTGSLLALAGIAILYMETGYTSYEFLKRASILPKALIVAGFGVEAAVFPLHFWLPDAHMAAPSTASALLSGVTIETAAVIISRAAVKEPTLQSLLVFCALAGMFVGNLSAYVQDDIKRILAYSSVANVSYVIFGLNIGSPLAYRYSILHIVAHGFLKASFFIFAGILLAVYGTRSLKSLQGVLSDTYVGKFIVVAAGMGLTGVPPFLTFWSEAFTVIGVFAVNPVLALLFGTAIISSFGYYFNAFYTLSHRREKALNSGKRTCVRALAASLFLIALSVLLGLRPELVLGYFNI